MPVAWSALAGSLFLEGSGGHGPKDGHCEKPKRIGLKGREGGDGVRVIAHGVKPCHEVQRERPRPAIMNWRNARRRGHEAILRPGVEKVNRRNRARLRRYRDRYTAGRLLRWAMKVRFRSHICSTI